MAPDTIPPIGTPPHHTLASGRHSPGRTASTAPMSSAQFTTIAAHIGREQIIDAAGRQWKFGRWDRSVWFEFLAWARTQLPNPLDKIRPVIEQLTSRQAALLAQNTEATTKEAELLAQHLDGIVRLAINESMSYLSVGSAPVADVVRSLEGTIKILWLLLRKHQPNVTEDDAFDIFDEVGLQNVQNLMNVASGEMPTAPGNA